MKWNDSPEWAERIETYEPAIKRVAAIRMSDPELRPDVEQYIRIKLFKLFPEKSTHYAAYQRGEKTDEDWEAIINFLINMAISRGANSAVYRKDTRRWGEAEILHEPWPETKDEESGEYAYIEFPDEHDLEEEVTARLDWLRMVRSPFLTPMRRELLVMWSMGYDLGTIGRILGMKYRGAPLSHSGMSYHLRQSLQQLRERYNAN